MENHYDVIIIGAGVVGNAIARELSQYSLRVAVIEKELDVSMGTSSRNSGVIHSGIHYKPGTLRARLNVLGNSLMADLCQDLKVKINYLGKLTVAQDEQEVKSLYLLKEQGEANGVPGLEILDPDKMRQIQPNVGGIKALHSPSTGIISPYSLTIALRVKEMVATLLTLDRKESFDGTRSGMTGSFHQLSDPEKADLVSENPDYGEIVCRCEQITKKEVLDAIENPLGVRTINSIKYRSRAMMGRCQGGFCLPRIVQILEKEFGYNPEDYLLKSRNSPLFIGKMRQEVI